MIRNSLASLAWIVSLLALVNPIIGTTPAEVDRPTSPLEVGDSLPSFSLADTQGNTLSSDQLKPSPVAIIFFGVECPIVKFYAAKLPKIAQQFPRSSIQWIGVNSNQHDSLQEIQNFAKQNQISVPLLKDPGNQVADVFSASRTPEVFLFDAEHELVYRGAIDDQYIYGQQKNAAEHEYLVDAINAMNNGEPCVITRTEPVGCIIGRRRKSDESSPVTYCNQISRIIQQRCLHCHRDGEIAPFSMMEYEEVAGWAEMILEVTTDRRMPPWHAHPAHGDFKNNANLTDTQLQHLGDWVAAGAPQGNPADLPAPLKFTDGWQMGQPDVVIAMAHKPVAVPATGVVPYQYFVVDPEFTEDKWIQSAECRIGNRKVVHHIIVGLHDGKGKKGIHGGIDSEWIAATAPGSPPLELPTGFAKLIPAGSKLIFQMHYTPVGTAQTDLSSVGFKFADPASVKKIVGTRAILNKNFRIPPGDSNHEVTADFHVRHHSLMLSMFPHMHLRGKSFRYTANYPNGETEILLDVPNYDFNWQNGYEFVEPKFMPAGTVIDCVAHFDNSEKNFANPDPTQTVHWGDQTWDEMMIGYFNMAIAEQDLTKK